MLFAAWIGAGIEAVEGGVCPWDERTIIPPQWQGDNEPVKFATLTC